MIEYTYKTYGGLFNPKTYRYDYKLIHEWSKKMKTKEIDCWYWEKDLEIAMKTPDEKGVYTVIVEPVEKGYKKAKLIIEVPEKSTTITESELESVLGETECVNGMDMYYRIKNKLFGNG